MPALPPWLFLASINPLSADSVFVRGTALGPISRTIFFHRNSNSMEILFCCHPGYIELIAINFCTWHNSCAVVACVKLCSDMMPYNGVILKPIFHRIWIGLENRSLNGVMLIIVLENTLPLNWERPSQARHRHYKVKHIILKFFLIKNDLAIPSSDQMTFCQDDPHLTRHYSISTIKAMNEDTMKGNLPLGENTEHTKTYAYGLWQIGLFGPWSTILIHIFARICLGEIWVLYFLPDMISFTWKIISCVSYSGDSVQKYHRILWIDGCVMGEKV